MKVQMENNNETFVDDKDDNEKNAGASGCNDNWCVYFKTEALHDGLVGHWELGETHPQSCTGEHVINHGGGDWLPTDSAIVQGSDLPPRSSANWDMFKLKSNTIYKLWNYL